MVPAAEAVQLGLFDRVVPHADLAAETRKLAETWAAMSPLACARRKTALYRSEHRTLTRDARSRDRSIRPRCSRPRKSRAT